jgi:hypothetical protein
MKSSYLIALAVLVLLSFGGCSEATHPSGSIRVILERESMGDSLFVLQEYYQNAGGYWAWRTRNRCSHATEIPAMVQYFKNEDAHKIIMYEEPK